MMLLFKRKVCCLFILCLAVSSYCYAGNAQPLLQRGWAALVRDDDTVALQYFGQGYLEAERENDTADKAQALLYMGICSYGVSYSMGYSYCSRAMDEYKKMEGVQPLKALEGRSRCLQLISTIKSRQGKYREAIATSKEALNGFAEHGDTTGYRGIIYNSLGLAYKLLGMQDSSERFFRMALAEHLANRNLTYLPAAYIKVADIEAAAGNKQGSLELYTRGAGIADSTGNKQAQVLALIGLGDWQQTFDSKAQAEVYYKRAANTAGSLSDRSFSIKAAEKLLNLYKAAGDYRQAIVCRDEIAMLQDSLYSRDRQIELKKLEIQFDVAEKDRQLKLLQKESEITRLTNYLLWGGILALLILSAGAIYMLRRINRRDKLLLQAKDALVAATEEQKKLREQQMQQELEFKESQLSAMTLQMLQKNELMQELKERLDEDAVLDKDLKLGKIISKGLTQDKEWSDFNTYFESINKNFYTRLKQAYPDISPNDLRICALIKLNLSIKEMAAILNISPDSVKTARYRLRKKLQLNNEDNLTEFILGS